MKENISSEDVKSIREFTQQKMHYDPNPAYITHTWDLTENLLSKAKFLIKKEKVEDINANMVYAIIYFVNVGFVERAEKPLQASAQAASEFLSNNGFSQRVSHEILEGIKQVKADGAASFQAATIAQDAYNSYMGSKGFVKFLKKRYEEYNISRSEQVDQEDQVAWMEKTVDKMVAHKFNTRSARKKWSSRKKSNLGKLRKYIYKLKKDSSLTYNKRALTMFKTASRNQVDLVNIADKKAGLMITVNAILITILLPLFASYIIDLSEFLIPATILLLTCGLSIVLATLATKPISRAKPTRKDFVSGNRSLFYFENFITLNKEEYKSAIQELIVRDAPFENAVITDLYDLGAILGKKYQKLTWCYATFATGIGLTILTLIYSLVSTGI